MYLMKGMTAVRPHEYTYTHSSSHSSSHSSRVSSLEEEAHVFTLFPKYFQEYLKNDSMTDSQK